MFFIRKLGFWKVQMQQSSRVPRIRPSTPIQIQLKSTSICVKRPAAAQKMAEMKNPILDYREPSSGSWMNEQTKSNSRDPLWAHLFYGLTKTKHTHKKNSYNCFVFFLFFLLPSHLRLLESMWKLKYKIKIYVTVQYFTITFHKYSIYINTHIGTHNITPFEPCKNLQSPVLPSYVINWLIFYCKWRPTGVRFTVQTHDVSTRMTI